MGEMKSEDLMSGGVEALGSSGRGSPAVVH